MDSREALVAISIAAICCDGLFSHHEATILKERLLRQAFALDMSEAVLQQIMEGLLRSSRGDSWADLVSEATSILTSQEKEKAFIMAVQLIYSDRLLRKEEEHFIDLLSSRMGLSQEWANGILDMFSLIRRE